MNTKYKDPARKSRKKGEGAARAAAPATELHFTGRNHAILGAAAVVILAGFLFLSRGSITLAPILLVLGYCVLIPYGLAAGGGKASPGPGANSSAG